MSGERIPIVFYKYRGLNAASNYLFGRPGSDETLTVDQLPPGAAWWCPRESRARVGPDGRGLYVKTPGGLWFVDGMANNCTRRDDEAHRCWVRHGSPEDGTLHVDKEGDTCGCGSSIGQGPGFIDYHGFLHHGHLIAC
jgi:hypothetical protein